jgi:hypothetical protein
LLQLSNQGDTFVFGHFEKEIQNVLIYSMCGVAGGGLISSCELS